VEQAGRGPVARQPFPPAPLPASKPGLEASHKSMFDFAWSEIALIAAVALVVIGPKDMPVAIRAVTGMIKKARRMASEFQTHVDEMMKDADLHDVRNSINEIRNFDVRGAVERAVDPDRSLRSTFDDPLVPPTTYQPSSDTAGVTAAPVTEVTAEPVPPPEVSGDDLAPPEVSGADLAEPALPEIPAWVPPDLVPPDRLAAHAPVPEPAPAVPDAPAFIPPAAVRQQRSSPRA